MSWHRHVWKVVERVVSDTPFETMSAAGWTYKEITGPDWFERDVIVTSRCEVCGTEKVERV